MKGRGTAERANLHCINQRSLTLKAVGDLLAHLVQEVIEWNAEEKHLQNLLQVSTRSQSLLENEH